MPRYLHAYALPLLHISNRYKDTFEKSQPADNQTDMLGFEGCNCLRREQDVVNRMGTVKVDAGL